MKKLLRIAAVFLAVMMLISAVTLVVLLNFNWNLARPWLNARTSEALGRPFAISGDLSLSWKKQTSICYALTKYVPWQIHHQLSKHQFSCVPF